MKPDIHPVYDVITVKCNCGQSFETRSTCSSRLKELRIEICSHCHPFYTGKEKKLDTGGRINRFNKRYQIVSDKNPE